MAKAPAKRLLVLRSGLTDWDASGRVQGATDLPMCQQGRDALEAALTELARNDVSAVVSAPDESSRATARVVADRFGGRIVIAPDLREMELGLWEGMRYEDLERRFCRAGRLFLEDPCGVTAPEGEALEQYSQRLMKTFNAAVGKFRVGSNVVFVLRPLALGVVRCALNHADLGQLWSMVADRPMGEWYEVQRNDPRLKCPPSRHAAAQTAAA